MIRDDRAMFKLLKTRQFITALLVIPTLINFYILFATRGMDLGGLGYFMGVLCIAGLQIVLLFGSFVQDHLNVKELRANNRDMTSVERNAGTLNIALLIIVIFAVTTYFFTS